MDASSVSIDRLRCFHNLSTRDDLLQALGGGVITLGDADVAVLKGKNPDRTGWSKYLTFFMRHHDDNEEAKPQEEPVPLVIDKKKPLILNEETIGRYTICDCCHPIPDSDRFPCLRLAYESIARGGNAPCVLNAANEIANLAFREGRIGFADVPRIIEETLTKASFIVNPYAYTSTTLAPVFLSSPFVW